MNVLLVCKYAILMMKNEHIFLNWSNVLLSDTSLQSRFSSILHTPMRAQGGGNISLTSSKAHHRDSLCLEIFNVCVLGYRTRSLSAPRTIQSPACCSLVVTPPMIFEKN